MHLVSNVLIAEDPASRFETVFTIAKTVGRVVYGIGMISTKKGEPYYDRQGDHIPPDNMQEVATKFMRASRTLKAMHQGGQVGEVIHSMPLTKELASAFGLTCDNEQWLVGVYVENDEVHAKAISGELPSFSIGGKGRRTEVTE